MFNRRAGCHCPREDRRFKLQLVRGYKVRLIYAELPRPVHMKAMITSRYPSKV